MRSHCWAKSEFGKSWLPRLKLRCRCGSSRSGLLLISGAFMIGLLITFPNAKTPEHS